MKYFIYCRKSTDEDNRQVQSIESQEKELIQFAIKNDIEIVETYKESKTAKMPGREIFNLMLNNIEKGKAEGVLSWHPDRLARNSIDGGKVIFLMDQGVIKDLKFPTYWVDNSPQGKFNLSLAFGQSKYYIDNLSQNVKRGQREKLRRGEYPAMAPIGYLNDKINKTIIPDPERALHIKRLFDEYATNRFSIKELANNSHKWGLKTLKGKKLSSSTLERILKSKFYIGMIVYNKEIHKGTHKPLINIGTFMQVQKILKNKGKQTQLKSSKEMLPFTGIMKCGECGCAITAEIHKGHVYYRCTKKKGLCSQKYTREEEIDKQVSVALNRISIDDEVKQLMIDSLEDTNTIEYDTHIQSLKFWQKEYNKLEEQKSNLIKLFTKNKITESQYDEQNAELLLEQEIADENLLKCKNAGNRWLEQSKNFIIIANQAFWTFQYGSAEDKKTLLSIIGSNFILTDKKLVWDWKKPFNILDVPNKRTIWSGALDEVRTAIEKGEIKYILSNLHIPKFMNFYQTF